MKLPPHTITCIALLASLSFGSTTLAVDEPSAGKVTHGSPTVVSPAGDPHQHLDQILDRPLFRAWKLRQDGSVTNSLPSSWGEQEWLRKPFSWIGDFFEWLFRSRTRRSNPVSNLSAGNTLPAILKVIAWIVLVIGVLVGIVFVIRMFLRPTTTIASANVLSRQQIRDAMESGDALAMAGAAWIDEANRLAAEQDFRAVYRALYLALLSGLHTAGKIEHARNRTNWTYVRRFRGPSDERDTFSELTALFDRVWYGRIPAEGNDLSALRRKVETLTRSGGVTP